MNRPEFLPRFQSIFSIFENYIIWVIYIFCNAYTVLLAILIWGKGIIGLLQNN